MCVVWVELKREVVSGVRDARAVKRRSTEAETRRRRGLEEVRKQRLESEARPGPVRARGAPAGPSHGAHTAGSAQRQARRLSLPRRGFSRGRTAQYKAS
jgi:hypothetical protein